MEVSYTSPSIFDNSPVRKSISESQKVYYNDYDILGCDLLPLSPTQNTDAADFSDFSDTLSHGDTSPQTVM